MKTTFRHKDSEYENEKHIERKKKIAQQHNKKSLKEKTNEYGVEDEDEVFEYERYMK